ncbi:antibiotic biosynthesis monooxygenase family protein [Demequina aurantiaca]|uniref:antibiotic biosynthesis monooxygenase family protein n=1 Tax=Demequina aurantiaca TaxID=676200 RepID=UPI003D33546B
MSPDSRIVESVVLPVRPGFEGSFEAAFATAEPLIMRADGYISHTLRRGIENPATYLLSVEWESVEAHEQGFRGSDDYREWTLLLHHFYEPLPQVLHYGAPMQGSATS